MDPELKRVFIGLVVMLVLFPIALLLGWHWMPTPLKSVLIGWEIIGIILGITLVHGWYIRR